MALLDTLLSAQPLDATADLSGWRQVHRELPVDPTAHALLGGLHSDRPAWAFGHGYQAALSRLIPGHQGVGALCVTEAQGNHPRSIQSQVRDGRLQGEKRFVLLGREADRLYVLAKVGMRGPRADLRLLPVDTAADGLSFAPGSAPLMPELPHSALTLDTPATPPLPGDGWADYVRTFRTLEDLHVLLALSGHLVRLCRTQDLPPQDLESLLPLVLALESATALDPDAPALHRALGALLPQAVEVFAGLHWDAVAEDPRARWERDCKILAIGGRARVRRLERARVV